MIIVSLINIINCALSDIRNRRLVSFNQIRANVLSWTATKNVIRIVSNKNEITETRNGSRYLSSARINLVD